MPSYRVLCIALSISIVPLMVYAYYTVTLTPLILDSTLRNNARQNIRVFTSSLRDADLSRDAPNNCTQMSGQLLPLKKVRCYFCYYGETLLSVIGEVCNSSQQVTNSIRSILYKMPADTLLVIYERSSPPRFNVVKDTTKSRHVLVATVSRAYQVTGTKQSQLIYCRKYAQSFGCSLDELNIMPTSFLGSNTTDCYNFLSHAATKHNSVWLTKPYNGVCGKGIEIYEDLPQLFKKINFCKDVKKSRFVIQEYLPNLLLFNERKFDIRAFILIARTSPYFLYYHPGYLRVAVNKLSEAGGREVHLTNTHIQEKIEGFTPEDHYWTFERFQQYISNTSSGNDQFVETRLKLIIKQTGLFLLQAGLGTFERLPATYLLLGLDFMVTSDYHVWFIEANNTPLWPKQVPFIYTMGREMLDLVIEIHSSPNKFVNSQPGDKYGSWELVYNELLANCSGYQYNPCRDFPRQ